MKGASFYEGQFRECSGSVLIEVDKSGQHGFVMRV